jgi:TRAP-type C4-dicarboxylate transport system permease small subunit
VPEAILNWLRSANQLFAVLIGIVLLLCGVFILADILLRQLGSSLGGTDEISGYVMAVVTSWGMSYALVELGHVRIEILRNRFSSSTMRALFDLFSMLTLSIVVSLIAWRCWPVLERSILHSSRANTPLETPLWLVQTPWFAGWVWFCAVSWLTFFAALALVFQKKFEKAGQSIGLVNESEMFQ